MQVVVEANSLGSVNDQVLNENKRTSNGNSPVFAAFTFFTFGVLSAACGVSKAGI
jgi:hypothetical protein